MGTGGASWAEVASWCSRESHSHSRESVVEDDWSEGGEDEQEELGVAGGEWLVSALVVASRGHRR